jgi:hypothetical protein
MGTDVFYGVDQSLLHHVGFGRLAARAADQLIGLLRQAGLFEPDAVVADLVAAGLAVEMQDGYPADLPVTPPPGWSVFPARKPG